MINICKMDCRKYLLFVVCCVLVNKACSAKQIPSCKPFDQKDLSEFLTAINYNPLVMSFDPYEEQVDDVPNRLRRSILSYDKFEDMESFFLDPNYSVSQLPNFDQLVDHIYRCIIKRYVDFENDPKSSTDSENSKRTKRNGGLSDNKRRRLPWQCDFKQEWIYLGPTAFPNYIRNVTCTQSKCGFGNNFECRGKVKSIVTLKQREEDCDPVKESKENHLYLPERLYRYWIRIDQAVVSCCTCSLNYP